MPMFSVAMAESYPGYEADVVEWDRAREWLGAEQLGAA
jgi:hypothetical protein